MTMNASDFLKSQEGNPEAYIPYNRVLDLLEGFAKVAVYKYKQNAKIKEALDKAAQEETYKHWSEAINDYADPQKGNPGRYTIDDIVYRAFEIYSEIQ